MPKTVSGAKPAQKKSGGEDWDSICIRKAANGFMISKSLPYDGKMRKDPDPYLATEAGEALDYIESCIGKREHQAHEDKEEKGEKE